MNSFYSLPRNYQTVKKGWSGARKFFNLSSIFLLTDSLPATYFKDSRDVKLDISHEAWHQIKQELRFSLNRVFPSTIFSKFLKLSSHHPFVLLQYSWRQGYVFSWNIVIHLYRMPYKERPHCGISRRHDTRLIRNFVRIYRLRNTSETILKLLDKDKKKLFCIKIYGARSILDELPLYRRPVIISKIILSKLW